MRVYGEENSIAPHCDDTNILEVHATIALPTLSKRATIAFEPHPPHINIIPISHSQTMKRSPTGPQPSPPSDMLIAHLWRFSSLRVACSVLPMYPTREAVRTRGRPACRRHLARTTRTSRTPGPATASRPRHAGTRPSAAVAAGPLVGGGRRLLSDSQRVTWVYQKCQSENRVA